MLTGEAWYWPNMGKKSAIYPANGTPWGFAPDGKVLLMANSSNGAFGYSFHIGSLSSGAFVDQGSQSNIFPCGKSVSWGVGRTDDSVPAHFTPIEFEDVTVEDKSGFGAHPDGCQYAGNLQSSIRCNAYGGNEMIICMDYQ